MTDKKEEYHSGGGKVFIKKTRQGGYEGSNRTYVNTVVRNLLLKGVFSTLIKICCCNTKVTVDLPMHSGWKPLQVRFGIHVREMEPCSK